MEFPKSLIARLLKAWYFRIPTLWMLNWVLTHLILGDLYFRVESYSIMGLGREFVMLSQFKFIEMHKSHTRGSSECISILTYHFTQR